MKHYDVYGIGNALVDMVFSVDEGFFTRMNVDKGRHTLIDEKTHNVLLRHLTKPEKMECGGSAANAMIAHRQLGGSAFYSCRVANDEAGLFYFEDLIRSGVDTNLDPSKLTVGITGKCLVMVSPDSDRTLNTHLGITETFGRGEIVESALLDSRYLYVEGYLMAQKTARVAAVHAINLARQNGVKTSITFSDPNIIKEFRAGIDDVIGEGVDLVFCNEEEAVTYTGAQNLNDACDGLRRVSRSFAVTRGAEGVLIFDGKNFIEVPSPKVSAVDTVGAGDMFAGTFLYGITHEMNFAEAGRLATTTAARVVTKFGPRLDVNEIKELVSSCF